MTRRTRSTASCRRSARRVLVHRLHVSYMSSAPLTRPPHVPIRIGTLEGNVGKHTHARARRSSNVFGLKHDHRKWLRVLVYSVSVVPPAVPHMLILQLCFVGCYKYYYDSPSKATFYSDAKQFGVYCTNSEAKTFGVTLPRSKTFGGLFT